MYVDYWLSQLRWILLTKKVDKSLISTKLASNVSHIFLETDYDFPDKTDQHASCNVSMTSLFEVILWLQSLLFIKIVPTFLMVGKTNCYYFYWTIYDTLISSRNSKFNISLHPVLILTVYAGPGFDSIPYSLFRLFKKWYSEMINYAIIICWVLSVL